MEPRVNLAKSPRAGHGFSLPELKKAGIDIRVAKKKGIRIDKRRKSAYDENIQLLKDGGKPKKEKKPVKAPKKKATKTKKAPPPPPKK
jgi:ribosomal protein L13E